MVNLVQALGIVALLYHTSVAGRKIFRFDYTYSSDIDGWWKLHNIPITWDLARQQCLAEGAVLLSPLNEHYVMAMEMIMATSNGSIQRGIYSGVHATYSKGVYTSIEGVPLSKIPVSWAPGEPDNYNNNESCLLFYSNGTMADINCNEVRPYICYKKKNKSVVRSDCGTTDSQYHLESRTGSCYKFHYMGQTWHQAYMTCAAEGGHLAIINSATEAQILKELFAKYPANKVIAKYTEPVSVGFYDWNKDYTWVTIHGETLSEAGYSNWPVGQPDNAKIGNLGQQCGGMFRSGLLDDVWCDIITFPFICEKKPDSLLYENS
ncbi:macrophage mannose receptor 1-like [Achroia grisella]|uniref:macrophage mannose receptor 1-like n=1 Tax=Achroia grisella TaxID=688607 RepID=UPI0027D21C5F|nr:macrophage mannose receptor 1-like [Achroia grisella]